MWNCGSETSLNFAKSKEIAKAARGAMRRVNHKLIDTIDSFGEFGVNIRLC